MVDISNKLHALVDEFVSNLSSECNSLAHNVSAEAHMYVAHDSALAGSQTQRTSNRTTSEVLNGLKRPSADPLTSSCNIEGKSEVQHLKQTFQAVNNRNREECRDRRYKKDMKGKSAALQELDDPNRVLGVDNDVEDLLSRELETRGGSTTHSKAKGRSTQEVELLSSDSASDDCPRPRANHSGRRPRIQHATKGRASASQGRSRRRDTRSPSWSPESSHLMDYSYEEDKPSLGEASPAGETSFEKLRWPFDLGGSHEDGGTGQKSDNDDALGDTENQPQNERNKDDVDISIGVGEESNGEDS